MFKRYLIFLLVIIIFNLNFLSVKAFKNKIIVKINNSIITDYDLKNKLKTSLILSNQIINQINIDKNKRRALAYLIDLKLKENELEKYKVKIKDLNVNNQLLSLSSNNIPVFEKKFQISGINFELFVNELKIETAWKQLMFNIYKEKVKINQEEIDKQVINYIENNREVKELKISEIEINFDKESNLQSEIDFIKKEIQENGFENTALKFSIASSAQDLGDIGWINSESFSPRINKVLKNLNIGEISEPIKNLNTLLFLKLVNIRTIKINDIDKEKFKEKIIKQKKNELFNLYSRSHLSKLKNNSLIEYK
tara:strand:+ start:1699 stop:2628 length:930 start_codon:yes stop_codon:yes gene_type:complete